MFKLLKQKEAQAMTEFILGLLVMMSFFFFYVKMAAVFALGNYIHYATFMAARAYSASDDHPGVQEQNAKQVLADMVGGRFKGILKNTGSYVGAGDYAQQDPSEDYWNQGVSYSYQTKLALYPWSKDGQSLILNLTSESWMPREESVQECIARKGQTQSDVQSKAKAVSLVWDNGC